MYFCVYISALEIFYECFVLSIFFYVKDMFQMMTLLNIVCIIV